MEVLLPGKGVSHFEPLESFKPAYTAWTYTEKNNKTMLNFLVLWKETIVVNLVL